MSLKSHSSGLTSAYDTHTLAHTHTHTQKHIHTARDIAVNVCKCTTIVFGTRCRRISSLRTHVIGECPPRGLQLQLRLQLRCRLRLQDCTLNAKIDGLKR